MSYIKTSETRYRPDFSYYENDAVIGHSIQEYGEYSQPEVDFLLSMLNDRSVVYDIGGNIGYHCRAFASKAEHVYSFEPNPDNYHLLKLNTNDVSNVTTFPCAVGHEFATCKISTYDLSELSNYGAVVSGHDFEGVETVLVPIDAMGLPKPDLIKIDVEGAELAVFLGARQTIAKHQPVIFYEAHETQHFREIYDILSPHPYRFYWVGVNNYNPNNYKNNSNNIFANTGLFSVIAWPKHLGELGLPEVQGRNDDVSKFYKK